MKKLIILLMFFSVPVMAEPIELTCNPLNEDKDRESLPLIIDLEENTAQLGGSYPEEINFKNEDYIVWVRNTLLDEDNAYVMTHFFQRKTLILKATLLAVDGDWVFTLQCIRSI